MKNRFTLAENVLICLTPLLLGAAKDELRLTSQGVIDQVIVNSLEMQQIQEERKLEDKPVFQAKAEFDWSTEAGTSYELSQEESLTGFNNEEDRTLNGYLGFQKKFRFGQTLTTRIERTSQSSILNSLSETTNIPPSRTLDIATVSLRQELLRNFIGLGDRKTLQSAQTLLRRADFEKQEKVENLIVESLKAFWKAYVAKENFEESLAARRRYRDLVKTVRDKSKVGFTNPGELARVEAELEDRKQRVKLNSATYLNELDRLYRLLQKPVPENEIQFVAPQELPGLPSFESVDLGELRPLQILKTVLKSQQQNKDAIRWKAYPKLSLLTKAQWTGLDEQPSEAFSETASGVNPIYYVGLEFSTPIASDAYRGEIQHQKALIQKQKVLIQTEKDKLRNRIEESRRRVRSQLAVAESRQKMVSLRKKAVSELQTAYQQGRMDLSEVILAYNALFNAQTLRTQAIGDYFISINELAAIQDQLIKRSPDHSEEEL